MSNEQGRRTYRYDQLGRLIAANFEDGVSSHYSYDAASSLVSVTINGMVKEAFLVAISGEFAGNEIPLNENWTTLGRVPEQCQLIFTYQSGNISRLHCRLRFEAGKGAAIVQDLGSSNGTWLQSGVRLDPHRDYLLAPGERFYLGTDGGTAFEMRMR